MFKYSLCKKKVKKTDDENLLVMSFKNNASDSASASINLHAIFFESKLSRHAVHTLARSARPSS